MPQQFPDNNELVMNMMFMIAALERHGLKITDMRTLHTSLQRLAPFRELRQLFGQGTEEVYHLRIARSRGPSGEVVLYSGTQQMCIEFAKTTVMNILDVIGEAFLPMQNNNYFAWRSPNYVVYVVPDTYKL